MAEAKGSRYDDCAAALEQAFQRCFPTSKKGPPSQAQWAQALVGFNREARQLRSTYRLGVLGRARVALRFQRRMIAQGHPPDMVRQLVFSMVINAFVG